MLAPKKLKYRKSQKGKLKGFAQNGNRLAFGNFGLKAIEPVHITSRQIEAARIVITRHLRREGKVWIRIFPDTPVTQKPAEVRMGKGKGNPEYYAARVKPGKVLFEVDGVSKELAEEALKLGAQKMPSICKLVTRRDYTES